MCLYKRLCQTLAGKAAGEKMRIVQWNQIDKYRDKSHSYELSSSTLILQEITTAGQTEQKSENPMTAVLQICMNGHIRLKKEATGRVYDMCYSLSMCVVRRNL